LKAALKTTLQTKKDLLPLFEMINSGVYPVYAMIAPAFTSQYGPEVTPGKLRSSIQGNRFCWND